MRRPVKPFVTEYKASNRRNPGAPGDQSVFESERPSTKPFDFPMRAEPEESYDAAMRAADALFSIPPEPKHDDATAPEADGAPQLLSDGSHKASQQEKSGGRILRVLDEEPEPDYAMLDAEHAPKRRGRKPGSKNKPKALSATAPFENGPEALQADLDDSSVVVADATAPAVPAARKIPALTASAVSAKRSQGRVSINNGAATGSILDGPVRGDTRFPWVRDRLKPGEDWKRRRLPRICW